MKTTMKKIFSLMLVAVMLIGVLPFQASADEFPITVHVYVDGNWMSAADFGATTNADGSLKLAEWQSFAASRIVGKQVESPVWSWAGGDSFDPNAIVTAAGWEINVSFTEKVCPNGCGKKLSACICCPDCDGTTANHINCLPQCAVSATCTNSVHYKSCVGGCTGEIGCPQTSHKDGCKQVATCGVCGTAAGQHTAECTADCTGEVGCATKYAHKTDCKQTIICSVCGKVGGAHLPSCLDQCTNSDTCTNSVHKYSCTGPCTKLADCKSQSHKTGCTSLLNCSYCGKKGHISTACPDVFYSCGCSKAAGHKSDCTAVKWTVTFNPNYNTAAATSIGNVVSGTKLYDVYTPVRVGYTFEAWYYDANMTSIVPSGTTVTGPMTVYAKWKQIAPYNVSVVVYTNGNKNTPTVTLDLYSWAQDGVITLSDLKRAIEINGIKANNDAGLSVYGPFTPDQWTSYIAHDYYRNATEKVNVKNNETTVLYAMVHNVKITKGTVDPYGAIADKTNPKTGDMIFAPVAVMGLSVSALAVLLYLNKKRAF